MSDPYEEILDGEFCLRLAPGDRHEVICERLHQRINAALQTSATAKLLPARSLLKLAADCEARPDVTIVTAVGHKVILVAEIINSGDHSADTVIKKQIYETAEIPRLWMVDPRYDNVEIYHGTEQGLILKNILAIRDVLAEPLLPHFEYPISQLFAAVDAN